MSTGCWGSFVTSDKIARATALCGAASYELLAVNMLNPDLILKFSSNRDLTNLLLAGSLVGGTVYLSQRPHILALPTKKERISYSLYGSVMVSFGSLLLWAMARALVPDNSALRTVVAVGSGYVLLKTGNSYVNLFDNAVASRNANKTNQQ